MKLQEQNIPRQGAPGIPEALDPLIDKLGAK
jgi:hypothetical protein